MQCYLFGNACHLYASSYGGIGWQVVQLKKTAHNVESSFWYLGSYVALTLDRSASTLVAGKKIKKVKGSPKSERPRSLRDGGWIYIQNSLGFDGQDFGQIPLEGVDQGFIFLLPPMDVVVNYLEIDRSTPRKQNKHSKYNIITTIRLEASQLGVLVASLLHACNRPTGDGHACTVWNSNMDNSICCCCCYVAACMHFFSRIS